MSKFLEELKKYGVDLPTVMERYINDEEMYKSCLQFFMTDTEYLMMEQMIEENKYKEAFEHAHTLKGVVGNLGLDPLYEVICKLVEVLRYEEYDKVEDANKVVISEMERCKELLETLL